MSRGIIGSIGEYLDMVKKGIQNGDKIIEAVQTAAKVKKGNPEEISPEAVAEIMRRKEICKACPFFSRNKERQAGYKSALPFSHCTLCKCRVGYDDSKEYCLSCKCGLSVWNESNPDKPQQKLKWDTFVQPEKENNN